MKKALVVFLVLLINPSFAADKPDPDYLEKMIKVLQVQRNQAMDALAISDEKNLKLLDALAKDEKKIKELENKKAKK
jgi:hypothetical protein